MISSPTTWRGKSRLIIAAVISIVGTQDMPALRRALRDAYPFGERKYWPYKIWLDEIRRQLTPVKPKRKDPGPSPGPALFPDEAL